MPITLPTEAWPSDATIESLDGTTDARTGLPYIAKGTGPTSVPSYEVQYNRRLERQNRMLEPWRRGMVVDEGDLKIGVYPFDYALGGVWLSFPGATGQSVPDDSQRVVYIDASNALRIEDVWPSDKTSFVPLAVVGTQAGVLQIEDLRVLTAFHVPQVDPDPSAFARVIIPDGSGASPQTVGVHVEDINGNDLDETVYFVVSVHDAADGGGFAANATIAVGTSGTLIESLTAGKELFCKTNASGQLDVEVTDGTAETVYLMSRGSRRSKRLDCSDVGTVVIS